jgi:hypothetical protein
MLRRNVDSQRRCHSVGSAAKHEFEITARSSTSIDDDSITSTDSTSRPLPLTYVAATNRLVCEYPTSALTPAPVSPFAFAFASTSASSPQIRKSQSWVGLAQAPKTTPASRRQKAVHSNHHHGPTGNNATRRATLSSNVWTRTTFWIA